MPELERPDGPLTTNVKWRFPSVHPEGRKYVVGAAFITLAVYWLASHFLGFLLAGVTIWVATFFRDPIRTTPRGDKFIIAPADGLITMIAKVPPPPELRRPLRGPPPNPRAPLKQVDATFRGGAPRTKCRQYAYTALRSRSTVMPNLLAVTNLRMSSTVAKFFDFGFVESVATK